MDFNRNLRIVRTSGSSYPFPYKDNVLWVHHDENNNTVSEIWDHGKWVPVTGVGSGSGDIIIDTKMSDSSSNAIANKTVKKYIDGIASKTDASILSLNEGVAALQSLIDTMNPGYQFMGVATPETNPGTPDQKVFYIANGKSTYPTFGGIEVSEDEVVILYYDTAWHKLLTGIASQEKLTELEGKAVNFTGTDGTSQGTQGFVPAPDTTDKDKFLKADGSWQKPSDYFYNENVSVDKGSQRFKSYMLEPGSKIVIRVSLVSGTTTNINLYWIKEGGNEIFLSGYPIGYITDVLTVPDDATGVQIFMNLAASGNVNKIEIWDATKAGWVKDKIGQFGLDFLNNRKMISKTVTIPANNAAMDLLTLSEGRLANLSGDIYAYISASPEIPKIKDIRFWKSTDIKTPSSIIQGFDMRQDKVFKIFYNGTLNRVSVLANTVTEDTEVTMTIFAVDPAVSYLNYPLYGKKIMCFGDSITDFVNETTKKGYPAHLQEYSQAIVNNAGIGGTRYAQRLTPSLAPTGNQECYAAFDICNMVIAWATEDYSLQEAALASGFLTEYQQTHFEEKLAVLKNNPIAGFDIVTIMAGTNDYNGGSPVGLENQETMDKGTIRGAINAMVSALLTAKPTIEINFFSPLIFMIGEQVDINSSSDVSIVTNAPDGMTFPAYIEKIHDAVKGNHCPFNDMYWSLGWNVYNFSTFFTFDKTHPYLGFKVIAEKMYKYLLAR